MTVRVAILVDHQSDVDTRVYRTAHALAQAGYDTRVFAAGIRESAPEAVAPLLSRQFIRVGLRRKTVPAIAEPSSQTAAAQGQAPVSPQAAPPQPAPLPSPATPSRARTAISRLLHFRAHYWSFAPAVLAFAPDIIHANDLNTLPAGSQLARRAGARLIYDAHEYEADRNHAYPLPHWVLWQRRQAERHYARQADATITVSPGIAERMRDNLGIARPHVILNTPDIDLTRIQTSDLARDPLRLIHVGLLRPGRLQEVCVEALQHLPQHHLRLVGPVLPGFADTLLALARRLGVADRVQLVAALPPDELLDELRRAAASLVLMPDHNTSCELALPNKLFESLAAGTPVIASNRTEMARIVTELECGALLDDHSASGIARAVTTLQAAPPDTVTLPERYRFAAQKCKLLEIYERLAAQSRPRPSAPR